MQLKKQYKIILNYIIGPLLFVVLSYSIYKKIEEQPQLLQSWYAIKQTFIQNRWWLLVMFLLMIANWMTEAWKWQILVAPVQKVSLLKAVKSVLCGLSFSMFIPNGIGDYFGRMLYMDEGNRLKSVAVNFVNSISKLIATLFFGLFGLLLLLKNISLINQTKLGLSIVWIHALCYMVAAALVFCVLLFFKISLFVKWFEKIPFVYKHRVLISSLEVYRFRLLIKVLFITFLRYAIFVAQYILVFYLFNILIPFSTAVWLICSLLLLMAIIPSIPIAELGIRGELGIRIFGLYSTNTLGIVGSAGFIWLVNILIPALVGSLFVLSIRVFKKNLKNTQKEA